MQKTSAARSTPATSDPDVNVRLRGSGQGWKDANFFPKVLQDHAGAEPRAPQLSTLIGDTENHNPTFTYFGQVYSRSGSGLDSSNTAVPGVGSIQAGSGTTMYSPKQGYELGGGYSYVILYASPTDIVIHDTAEDSVASGYTIHLFNINVDPKLLSLYNQNESSGRAQLVAIPCHAVLGTVAGPDMRIIIRDTGSFMDVRYKDWWTQPVISNCKDIPPGLLTAPKKPPAGEFLPNDPIDVPKTVVTKKNPDVSIGSSITDSGAGFDTSTFEGATFYDAAIPGNKLDELFQPALDGGGKLVPSRLQAQVQNPSQQKYPPGSPEELGQYNEVYDPGCTKSQFAGSDKSSDEKYAKNAAEAKLPDKYPDFQANLHNLSSMLVPGKTSSLQWQIRDPGIAVKGTDGKFILAEKYATRFHCGAQIDPKQVSAVNVPVTGPIETFFSTVNDVVTKAWSLITGEEKVCDSNGKCSTYNKYKATLVTTNTATIKTPAMKDIKDTAIGQMGALFAFHPNAVKDKLPKVDGFTNKNQGSGNVLGVTTDPNDPASLPHGGTYAVAKTWQLTSSCMLIPASIQQQRSTDCKLGPETSPEPTPPTIPQDVVDFANRVNPRGNPPVDWVKFLAKYDPDFIKKQPNRTLLLQRVNQLLAKYGKDWTGTGLGDPAKQTAIQQAAKNNGINEAFLYALWIEETHAGSAGNREFGCGSARGFDASLACVTSNPTVQTYLTKKPFGDVLCTYAYGGATVEACRNAQSDFLPNITSYVDYLTKP